MVEGLPVAKAVSLFSLNQLGWLAFQRLCGTLLSETLGQTFQVFGPGRDGGRDGAFRGHWTGTPYSGAFTVQCKHFSGERRNLRPSDLTKDVQKARLLVKSGLADVYIVMTNASVSAPVAAKVESFLRGIGVRTPVVYGADWIESKIVESARLRALVPRLYGLGDLTQILDERAYQQASEILRTMSAEIARFVPTASYRSAVDAFQRHRFVMLVGEPAAGKTLIAYTLALFAADSRGARTVEAADWSYVRQHWNANEPQVFILDDVFGATQYQRDRADEWNRNELALRTLLKTGWVICTSRDYIYRQARRELKPTSFPLLDEGNIVVDVDALAPEEKRQILYNHIKMGDQSRETRRAMRPHLSAAAGHPSFKPETARRLGTKAYTENLHITAGGIESFVAYPERFLAETINSMEPRHRGALVFLFSRGGQLASPVQVSVDDHTLLDRLGLNLRDLGQALSEIRDRFVRLATRDGSSSWWFQHPTIHDVMAGLVRDDPELLDVYVQGTPLLTLLSEVTCGDTDTEGAGIDIPRRLFPSVGSRLSAAFDELRSLPHGARWRQERALYTFLEDRCSRQFLEEFTALRQSFIEDSINVGAYLMAENSLGVVAKLARVGLLDDRLRRSFVQTVSDLAVDIPDTGWRRWPLHEMLTEEEVDSIKDRILEELVPRLHDVVRDLVSGERDSAKTEDDFRSGIADRVSDLDTIVAALQEGPHGSRETIEAFERAIARLTEAAAGSPDDWWPEPSDIAPMLPGQAEGGLSEANRSLFDDVDV